MISIAIIEDNASDAELLKDYSIRAMRDFGETCEIEIFPASVAFLESYRGNYDIVFMDIELPDINGMDAAKRLRAVDSGVIIVFVTNMAMFAVKGYEVDALDFIIKPISFDNIYLKIRRILSKLSRNSDERMMLQTRDGTVVVNVSDVKYVEIMNHKLIFHTRNGEIAVSGSLKNEEARLEKFGFSRCKICYLVNLRYVNGINDFSVDVDGEQLTVSRSCKKQFMKDLALYLGGGFNVRD